MFPSLQTELPWKDHSNSSLGNSLKPKNLSFPPPLIKVYQSVKAELKSQVLCLLDWMVYPLSKTKYFPGHFPEELFEMGGLLAIGTPG